MTSWHTQESELFICVSECNNVKPKCEQMETIIHVHGGVKTAELHDEYEGIYCYFVSNSML